MGGDAMSGTLWGVGVGPGAPDLLTLRAARVIEAAAVVAYPGGGMARAVAAAHVRGVEMPMELPMARDRAPGQAAYDGAAAQVAVHLAEGRDVAWLCEGDPLFYGSFLYLRARLAPRFPVRVVPGVTSVSAAAALAQVPLGAREGRLAVLPATLPDESLRGGLMAHEATAILKLGRHFPRVRALLESLGLAGRTTYVARATWPDEVALPLREAPEAAPYFSLLLVAREADPWT